MTSGHRSSRRDALNISAAGTGDRSGNPIILQGSITVFGGTLGVVSGGGGQTLILQTGRQAVFQL